jgi:hypothetical protein
LDLIYLVSVKTNFVGSNQGGEKDNWITDGRLAMKIEGKKLAGGGRL